MGLADFLMKRSRYVVPGIQLRKLMADESFEEEWLQDPLFRDLLVCMGQLAKTELDISRLGSNGYMKKVSYGKYTIKDKPVRALFEALEVEVDRLQDEGYITNCMRKLTDAAAHAAKSDKDQAAASQNAVYATSVVLARYILDLHPEYNERIRQCGKAVKEYVK